MRELTSKKKVLIVSFLLIILMIYYIGTYYSDGLYHNKTNYGAYIFYTLNSFLPFYLLLAFLSNNLVTSNFYQNKYSKFQNMIIPRIGFKKRILYEIKTVLFSSIIVRLMIHIFTLIVIHLFFSEIHFQGFESSAFVALNTNATISLLLYIIYSTIGFAIFSLFLYSLIYFIKNKYIYNVSGIIIFVILAVSMALIGNALYANQLNVKLFNPLLEAINTLSLILPGLETSTAITSIRETNLYFGYTCIMFLIYSCILCFIGCSWTRKKG